LTDTYLDGPAFGDFLKTGPIRIAEGRRCCPIGADTVEKVGRVQKSSGTGTWRRINFSLFGETAVEG